MVGSVVQCHTVGAVEPANLAQEFAMVWIYHHDPILSRNEEAIRGGVEHDVIPSAIATELDLSRNMVLMGVAGLGRECLDPSSKTKTRRE
jgi:hypothetical protein